MIIEVKANLKLNKGGLMRKGRYDDAEEPFPQEIYTEIKNEEERLIKRGTILVLSDEGPIPVSKTIDTTTLEPDTGVTKTEDSEEKDMVVKKKSGKMRTRKK